MPNQKAWLKTIFSKNDWIFDNNSILIGHSAGATLILRILERLEEGKRIHKALLVAGPVELGTKSEYFQYKADLVHNSFDWVKIKNSCRLFYFFHSDNDKYECGIDQGKILQQKLGGKLIFLTGEGHFNLEQGPKYKQFPELLEIIKRDTR